MHVRFLVACVAMLASPAYSQEVTPCPASQMAPVAAPHSRDILAAHQELLIVALGSSSTQSWKSSDPAHSYPAVLQERLSQLLPGSHVAVINRGIAGQDAAEEVTRIDSDVIAIRPGIVIWQVGANGVLQSVDPAVYKSLLTTGIGRLQKAGIDVVLMDNQRSPAVEESPEHLLINAATADAAAKTGAALFSRSELMDQWQHAGMPYGRFISPDRMHHNDLGYRCMANALARSIAAGLGPDRIAVASPGTGVQFGAATK